MSQKLPGTSFKLMPVPQTHGTPYGPVIQHGGLWKSGDESSLGKGLTHRGVGGRGPILWLFFQTINI